MQVKTFADILAIRPACTVCRKPFRINERSFKKSFSIPIQTRIRIGTTTGKVKIVIPEPQRRFIAFICSGNNHRHSIRASFRFNLKNGKVNCIKIIDEKIRFGSVKKYEVIIDWVLNTTTFNLGEKRIKKPSRMQFTDRKDILNKINRLLNLA